MKINPIINTNFRGILDSKESIRGKYLKYTVPLTRNTQQYERIYNGEDLQNGNVDYLQPIQWLQPVFVKEGGDYICAAVFIPYREVYELKDEANTLKGSVSVVLDACEAHKNEAKRIQRQLLDEFDEVNVDMISDSDLAFKTVDIETGKTTLAIPTKENKKLFNVYEFDSSGSLDRSLKNVEYLPDGSFKAQEMHIFDMKEYACLKNVEVQNGIIDCEHAYSFDICDMNKFSYSLEQTRKKDVTLAQYFVEYQNDKPKAYSVDAVMYPSKSFNCSRRYEFYSKDNYSCMYDYENANSNPTAEKMFVFENDKLSRVESKCRQNAVGQLQGEYIILFNGNKNFKPKGMV